MRASSHHLGKAFPGTSFHHGQIDSFCSDPALGDQGLGMRSPLLPALDGSSAAPRLSSVFNWEYRVLWPLGRGTIGRQDGVDESRKGFCGPESMVPEANKLCG